jgi:hypothetical protein
MLTLQPLTCQQFWYFILKEELKVAIKENCRGLAWPDLT